MIEIRLRFILVLVVLGLVIGYWSTIKNYWDKWTRPSASGAAALAGGEEFYCPMHPSVVRDQPDPGGAIPKCPICGMPLSKRKKGEAAPLPEGIVSRVQLSPYRIQAAGIRTAEVSLQPLTREVRTVGFVTVDESRLSRIVLRASSYVEKLLVNESFTEVREGQPLAEVYSPDLYNAASELLIVKDSRESRLVKVSRDKLRLLGVADSEIDEMVRTGKASERLIVRSPQNGHVFIKEVVEGDRVEPGQMLFEVADLSTVWIEGEVYEKDAAMTRKGQAVEATIEGLPGRVFQGRVGLVHPHLEPSTRTQRVRFELENPGHVLRPAMYATVVLKTPVPAIEPFRSRLIAWKEGQSFPTAVPSPPSGAGDGVNEQLPSESADESLIKLQKVCPVTGAKLGSMGKPVKASAGGRTVFLCCDGCEEKIAQQPDFYLNRLTTVTDEAVLAVPEGAVVDTGAQKVVYVEREPGLFEGVAVTLGPRSGGYYAVIDGLLPGDRVAAAGAFLVDAETRLNPAAAAAYFGASGGPESAGPSATRGTTSGSGSTPGGGTAGGKSKEQENLAKLPEADRKLAERQKKCPVTDLPLGSMGVPYKMNVQGKTLFLCCEGCKEEVEKDPAAALKKIRP
ncbi:MAG: efflux RND transporter periplasmic adaptor subunit [Planctomycetia bacterium]|nr:efflux RND transporter periplasmic adaptor subunit [Planctomycetia bacterium]